MTKLHTEQKYQWHEGKVLWFDDLSGQGMILTNTGENLYFHYSSLPSSKAKRKTIKDDTKVFFTIYDNGHSKQVFHIKPQRNKKPLKAFR